MSIRTTQPWRPTKTMNGWHPKVNDTGTHVLYGFWGTWVADLTTGVVNPTTGVLEGVVETEVLGPAAADGHHPRMCPLGWLNTRTFIAITEEGPAAVYSVSLDTLIPVNLNVPNFAGANFGNAANGHWGIHLTSQPYCFKDGLPFRPDIKQYGCYVNGDNLLTADLGDNYTLLHFVGNDLVRRLPADNAWHCNKEGDVTTGYYGPVQCYPFGQGHVDATITPWRQEEAGTPVRVNGDLWIWSATNDDTDAMVLGRRLGEKDPIVLRGFPSVGTSAVWTGTEWVIAGNMTDGAMQVRWVPMDTPREKLVMPFVIAPFNHPVLILPFKDPIGASGVKGIEAEEIGIYSETVDPTTIIAAAALLKTRVLLGHDSPAPWIIPSRLRPWDIPLVELYRVKTGTLGESVSRWRQLVQSMLAQWPGDCGVIPQFYCQGGAPPDELWTVNEVLNGLTYLSALVNLSPRIKVVAPFAWDRANGITAHPELRKAFESLLRATPGRPTLIPIGDDMVRPQITIKQFDTALTRGMPWHVQAHIGDTDVVVRIGGDGNLTIAATNPAGSDKTGMPRHVEVGAAPEPEPEPEPVPPPPPPVDPWETMVRETIRAVFSEDNRPAPTREQEDAILAKCYPVPRGEGWTHIEIRAYVQGLERPHVPTRSGVVTPEGRAVRDDQGVFHPLGKSFFWAMQGWKHERDHYERNAAWIAAKGFDYARILTEVGWTGREINPGAPGWLDWADVLRSVIDDLYNRGVRTELTLVGKGTNTDLLWLARTVGDIVADGRQHKIMDIEMANEYSVHGGPNLATLSQMAREVKARVPNLVALSSPGDFPALLAETKRIGINGMTWHSDRGSSDYKWRQVRQPYDSKNFKPFVLFNNEPAGPASSVATNTSPLQLAMTRAVGVMCGGAGYVLHTGTGVFGDGVGHPTAGPRPANFDEIENIDAIVDAVRGIDLLLPQGVENWNVTISRSTNSGNLEAPFTPHNHWEGNTGEGVNKAYGAIAPDGRWILMPCGVRGHALMTASYPVYAVTVYDPLTGQSVPGLENRSFNKGETMNLPGGGEDAMVAYVIQGRR